MTHRSLVFISLLAAAVLPQTAAAGLWQRCQEDVLSTTQAVGRNAWSRKCGYITISELAHALACLAVDDRHNGKTFNLVGDNQTQAALVQLANEVFGLKVRYETLSDEENIALLMQDKKIAVRGKDVARMLTGCFQCVRNGAFDVPSDFEAAAGRRVKSTRQMMEELRASLPG